MNAKIIDFETCRSSLPREQRNISGGLPAIPVMPETLLRMELCAHGRAVDLNTMTQVVLRDPGAVLQIVREAGQECVFGSDRPRRIEDCISALGVDACIAAVSRKTVSRAMNKPAIIRVWSHSVEIAKRCVLLADESINPCEAYLTGLLHELGSLPSLLEWRAEPILLSDPVAAGIRLADELCLPVCVAEYSAEVAHETETSRWKSMVQSAHEMSMLPVVVRALSDHREPWTSASVRL